MNAIHPIEIFTAADGQTEFKVQLQQDTVWLSLNQLTELLNRDKSVIAKHIRNVFNEGELSREAVVANFATTASDGKTYQVEHYNLDVIISVGYRVKSKQGTQFRIWATNVLRQYLIEGYALNQQRLREKESQLAQLQDAIRMVSELPGRADLSSSESAGIIKILHEYAHALNILDQYDHQSVAVRDTQSQEVYRLTYQDAKHQIEQWKNRYPSSTLFGNEKDDSFRSSVETIYQTFDGVDLYPSAEEKAAHLLYFVVKNHSFSDGNKRIAAGLFVWFLDRNKMLYRPDGSKRVADNALVALTLMIAESQPAEKELMINVVVNLINKNN